MTTPAIEQIHRHYSVRAYRPDPVPTELVETIVAAGQRASTSSNLQTYSVVAVADAGKRGKLAKSDAHNLWERLKTHESAVLLFAKDPQVPFTNNRAERDLRMAKVKQKVSGCFRVEQYAKAYCRISSYLQTMANKGHNPLLAIQMALAGEFDL